MIIKSLVSVPPLALALGLAGLAAPAAAFELNLGLGFGATIGIGGDSEASGGAEADAALDLGINLEFGGAGSGGAGGSGGGAGAGAEGGAAADLFANATLSARVQALMDLIAHAEWDANTAIGGTLDGAAALDVAAWLTAETAAQFEAVVTQNLGEILDLQAAINANASVAAWLQTEGVNPASVVALGATAEGTLVAFVY